MDSIIKMESILIRARDESFSSAWRAHPGLGTSEWVISIGTPDYERSNIKKRLE